MQIIDETGEQKEIEKSTEDKSSDTSTSGYFANMFGKKKKNEDVDSIS